MSFEFAYEWVLGWRYTRAGRATRRNGFISFISGVSMLGIGLGVAALVIVLSVMNGFQKEVRDRMLSVVSHIEVISADGGALDNVNETLQQVRANANVIGAAPFISAQALLARGEDMKGVLVRGIDPALEPGVVDLSVDSQLKNSGVPGIKALVPAEFGVVLIDRGSEVGGGETRGGVGCRAVISQAVEQLDGSWAVVAIGTERLHVTRWLEDDPYPRALVAVWADSDADQRQDPSRLSLAERIARRVFALAVEMGAQGDLSSIELSSDPSSRVYQLATLAPLGALDRQRLLATPDLTTRLELLVEMLEEQELLLQGRLSLGE